MRPEGSRRQQRRRVASMAVTLMLSGLLCALRWPGVNQDVAWSVIVARLTDRGLALYRDVYDVNTAPVFWLGKVISSLAGLLGGRLALALVVLVTFGTVASVVLVYASGRSRLTAVMGSVVLAVSLVGSGAEFGQREHWVFLFALPAVACVARNEAQERAWPAQLAGALLGIAVAIKPHFVVLWLGLVAVRLYRRQPIIAEAIAMAVLAVLMGLMLLLHPDYFQLVRDLGPLYMHWGQRSTIRMLLELGVLLPAFGVALLWHLSRREVPAPQATTFFLAALSCSAAAVMQGKGFVYHWFPAMAFACVGAAVGLVEVGERAGRLALACLLATTGVSFQKDYQLMKAFRRARSAATADIAGLPRDARVLVLASSSIGVVGPALEAGLDWTFRNQVVWWPRDSAARPGERSETEILDGSVVEAARELPEFILIDRDNPSISAVGSGFSMMSYVQGIDGMVEVLDTHYDPVSRTSAFYQYRRRDCAGDGADEP